MPDLARVAIVLHPDRPEAAKLAAEAIQWLAERGHRGVVTVDDAAAAGLGEIEVDVVEEARLTHGADLAVSLGGDGTMLRTVDLSCPLGVPVLGVNLGQLGYLSAVEPARLTEALERFLAGDYSTEERFTLQVEASGRNEPLSAVNEAVLEKTVPGHTVRLAVSIGGEPFITYAADGLIVATPTGSTAYNLSARGPILSPELQAVLVTPVSPHMLFDRSLVLAAGERVRVEVLDPRPAVLVVDGTDAGVLGPGDFIECGPGPCPARFVSFGGGPGFHSILKAKFGLADR